MDETVFVLGGGVAALSVARNLQIEGRRVAVIDPLASPGGASFGNGGFISPDSYMPGAQPGMLRSVPGWLLDPLGPLAIKPSYLPRALPWFIRWLKAGQLGRMIILARHMHALHSPALAEWHRLVGPELYARFIRQEGEAVLWDHPSAGPADAVEAQLKAEFGIEVDMLGPSELRKLYPGISSKVTRGMVKRGNAHTVSPAQLNAALAALMEREGARFIRERVLKLIREGDGWLVLTSTGNHRAREVVVACGVWSAKLIAPLGVKVPLESQRGYHVMLPADAIDLAMPFIHRGRGIGMTPMLEGVRVAGTVEFSGVDGVPNEKRADQALYHARDIFPALKGTPQQIWTGQRPAIPDSLPVLGAVPEHPGLWLCFGHGAYGMTGGPPSGHLVADLILKRPPQIEAAPYSVTRF